MGDCGFIGDFTDGFSKSKSRFSLLPVPYDGTSTWIKGADKGPHAMLDAIQNLEFYDIETDSLAYKQGIYVEEAVRENMSPEKMVNSVYERCTSLISSGKHVAVLGGEHSVSIGAIKAHNEKYPDMCVLQLDAHADLRDSYHGSRLNHACVMARAKEMCPIAQVGIRSVGEEEKDFVDSTRVAYAHDIVACEGADWITNIMDMLSENVYITIDLDVFDPSIMPSTGTPEPGGLSWYHVIGLLRNVIEKKNVVGFDVVELCPGQNKAPDLMAAKLIYKIITYLTMRR